MTHLAAVLGALGAPLLLIPSRRALLLAGLAMIALAEAVLAVSGPSGVSAARVALGLVGLVVLGLFTAVFIRRPDLVPLAILVAAPLRMPLDFGAAHRFYVGLPENGEIGRLLPLYGLIVAASIALAWRLVRQPGSDTVAIPREIAIPLGALVSFAALSVLWSSADAAAQNLLQYFLLPFAVLVVVVARSPFPAWMPRALGVTAVALAAVFSAVGIVEEATGRLVFYTPSVQIGNAYSSFFRVTSLFRDPSLYGRQLVLAMAIVLTAMWYRKIGIVVAAVVTGFLFAGLVFSYSQSSLVALFAVAVFISVVAGDRAVRVIATLTAVVVLAGGGAFVADKVAGASTQRVTSDRSRRIDLTLKVIEKHPLVGVGLGSQPKASQAASTNGGPPSLFVSHTTPLTVAAELGVVGLVLYAALLLGAAKALLRSFRLDAPFGLALTSVFAALFVHSLFYSGFFEDPITWLVLGVASSFLIAREPPPWGITVIDRRAAFGVLGVLGLLVALNVPGLGSDPWPFRTPPISGHGLLGPLVRAADGRWDLGVVRSPAVLAGVLVVAIAIAGWRAQTWRPWVLVAACVAVIVLVAAPATLLQVGLRDGSAPWFHVNDSTYQIELAGKLVRHGHTPYGHDYEGSGLERFYSRDGSVPPPSEHPQVALRHFAYFPGTALTAAAWSFVPSPFDDYRILVLLATIGCFVAVLLFDAPLPWRLAIGAAVAASPLLVRGAWFGTADATGILALLFAFALLTRSRYVWAAVALAVAILLKQFALVALPFFVVMLLARGLPRQTLVRASAAFGGVLLAGFLPFLIADPGALWTDTIGYGTGTYRILGYGLSALLLNAGVIDDRYGAYPFALLALLVWLPLTAWVLWVVRRSGRDWEAAAGFAASIFTLLFIARVFQTSYLVWPLAGIAIAFLLAQRSSSP